MMLLACLFFVWLASDGGGGGWRGMGGEDGGGAMGWRMDGWMDE